MIGMISVTVNCDGSKSFDFSELDHGSAYLDEHVMSDDPPWSFALTPDRSRRYIGGRIFRRVRGPDLASFTVASLYCLESSPWVLWWLAKAWLSNTNRAALRFAYGVLWGAGANIPQGSIASWSIVARYIICGGLHHAD